MPSSPLPYAAADALESAQFLDAPGKALGKAVRDAVPAGPVKDAMAGTWMGHALHPLLTDVVIGTWTSAVLLDLVGGRDSETAARRLLGIGLASFGPTAATGWMDWADTEAGSDAVRRAGLVHAVTNGIGAAVMAGSFAARGRGETGKGKLLGLAGISLIGLGGWLGAHLSYSRGVGVNTTALEKEVEDWVPTVPESSLTDGQPVQAMAGGTAVMLLRQNGTIHALADRCAHRGGALSGGEVADGTITCPVHGSCFRLEDGAVERGPAAYAQPVFDTRVVDGTVEVRIREAKSFVAT